MDEKLPARPSLEQLRKQAKELKDSQKLPTLSIAQLELARHYGFSSWPKLKLAVEVDALSRLMTERNYDSVETLLQSNPQLGSTPVEDGSYPLHYAVELNDQRLIQILANHGARLDQKWNGSAHTPLSWAVTYGSQDAAQKLVELGERPDLFTAAGMGLLDHVKAFWPNGQLVNSPSETGSSRSSEEGEPLPRPPIEAKDQVSDALYIASRNGRKEVAEWLLAHGADPNWRGFCGANSLAWAEFSGNSELCTLLIEKGADQGMRDYAFRSEPKLFPFMVLAAWGFPAEQLKSKLLGAPEMLNAEGGFGTLLNAAIWNDQIGAIQVLLELGADRERRNAAGLTALELAESRGNQAIIELLRG